MKEQNKYVKLDDVFKIIDEQIKTMDSFYDNGFYVGNIDFIKDLPKKSDMIESRIDALNLLKKALSNNQSPKILTNADKQGSTNISKDFLNGNPVLCKNCNLPLEYHELYEGDNKSYCITETLIQKLRFIEFEPKEVKDE